MIDIHCHLLPGVDDGPDTLDDALHMAEMAIADGITHVVATPHANHTFPFAPELVRQRRDELQARTGDRLRVLTGCDFHLSYENLQRVRANPEAYTINQKTYLLVELANFSLPPWIDDTLHELALLGLRPILTHPERSRLLRGDPKRLEGWLERGCYAQVTAASLLGGFGEAARHWALAWLEQNRVHFVASDAHNTSSRPLQLGRAYAFVAERRGPEVARALFRDNPQAALEGASLPFVPEPNAHATRPRRRRKRFLFF